MESRRVLGRSSDQKRAQNQRVGARDALRQRDFRLFFAAAAISNAGVWMQLVAVPALLYDLTGSATWLGVSSMASMLPAVLLTPYAGVLADRVSRRKILLITQAVQMTVALTLFTLYQSGSLTPYGIITCGLISGITGGIQTSAWQSFVPLLVPPHLLLEAVKLNSAQFTLARAIGPAMAGVLVKASGIGAALLVDGISYVLVLGALLLSRPRVGTAIREPGTVWEVMRGGARYVWTHPALRLATGIGFVAAFCGQSMAYMAPAVSSRVFGHSSSGNAPLLVALGCGAIISWGVFSWTSERIHRSTRVAISLTVYTASIAVIASTRLYGVGIAGYALNGLAHLQLGMSLNTLMQGSVPDRLRGRTTSFYILALLAGIPLGSFTIGRLADAIGMRPALFLAAAGFGAFTLALTTSGRLRNLDVYRIADADEARDADQPIAAPSVEL